MFYYSEKARLVDVCDNITKEFQDNLHLIVPNSSVRPVSRCLCFITSQDVFWIKLNDKELPRKKNEKCPASEILINSKNLTYESENADNDYSFQTQFNPKRNRAYLRIKTNAAAPGMEWLLIEVKGNPFHFFFFFLRSILALPT